MSKQVVSTSDAPGAVGPYSQAIVSDGLVFCSGQIPLDPATGELVSGSIAEETARCLDNLRAVLAAAGATMEDIVRVTVFLKDMADFNELNEEYAKSFGDTPPARVTVAVAGLPKGARIEIDCIARVPR